MTRHKKMWPPTKREVKVDKVEPWLHHSNLIKTIEIKVKITLDTCKGTCGNIKFYDVNFSCLSIVFNFKHSHHEVS